MGTLKQKLNKALESKAAIKAAIEAKGVANVGDKLSDYADKIKQILPSINDVAYGVEWDVTVADPHLTRIGNMAMHASLPIQSKYRGCIAKGNVIQYYLHPLDWSKKEDGSPAKLDGTDGVVKVHTPKFYGRSWIQGNLRRVMITETKLDDSWIEIPELLVDAYRATLINQVFTEGYLATLPVNSLVSVVNNSPKLRGGNNQSAYDKYLESDPNRTFLNKPRTSHSLSTFRGYARNAGAEIMCYEYYKWIFYWSYTIEYANFNIQEAYNSELTSEGYHQGGLGAGISNMNLWDKYNGNNPITPNGYGNDLGNFSGIKDLIIPEFNYDVYSIWVSQWAVDNNMVTQTNSDKNSKLVTSVKNITNYALYHNPDSVYGTTTYVISGLTDGQKVIFKEKQSGTNYSTAVVLKEVTQDGEVTINWSEFNVNGQKYIGFGKIQETCSIKIYNTNQNKYTRTSSRQVLKMCRWRGFDNPFGDIWTIIEGILLKRPQSGQPSSVYTTSNPELFGDSETHMNNMNLVATEIASDGWIKAFDLKETAEIVPSTVGGSQTQYKCDYHWCNAGWNGIQSLMVGGGAADGGSCGLGYFGSGWSPGGANAYVGVRTLIVIQ